MEDMTYSSPVYMVYFRDVAEKHRAVVKAYPVPERRCGKKRMTAPIT